jgi:hypothetical protein
MAAEFIFQKQAKSAGPFRQGDQARWRDFLEPLKAGTCFKLKATLPRYLSDHNRFFAVVQKAFENNRSGHAFVDAEHLRAWLLCEVGHCASFEVPADAAKVMGIEGYSTFLCRLMHIAAARKHAFATVDENCGVITIKMPESLSWAKLDQRDFAPIRNACYALIESRIVPGVTIAELFTAALEDVQ